MGFGQDGAEVEEALGLPLEIGKLDQGRRRGGIRSDGGFDAMSGGEVFVVSGINEIKHLPFCLGGKNRALVIDPFIERLALHLEMGPGIGVMIDPVTENEVVKFPNGLLEVIGDLKALQLHRREFLA